MLVLINNILSLYSTVPTNRRCKLHYLFGIWQNPFSAIMLKPSVVFVLYFASNVLVVNYFSGLNLVN